MDIVIREATDSDVPALAQLMSELGYPISADEMGQRYRQIKSLATYHTVVAVAEGRVAGMARVYLGYYYEKSGPQARVLALVVSEAYRSHGVGRKLLEYIEAWASARGAASVGLNSGRQRQAAHRFYRRHGYQDKTLGFYKNLDDR
jgi:GNAT superfamily N-acetyltransferase